MEMRRETDFQSARVLARTALQNGAEAAPMGVRWDISGKCDDPRRIEVAGIGHVKDLDTPSFRRTFVDLDVRCRRCKPCLRHRSFVWSQRATAEINTATRTWFGTLTLSPEAHYQMLCHARARHVEFDALSDCAQFAMRHVAISAELTKWLKRVRKSSGANLRYCLVAERHKSGLPHYHVLIHETRVSKPVRYRDLSDTWHLGFTKFNLVKDTRAAQYVCKYLSKDASARVRASIAYGRTPVLPVSTLSPSGGKPPRVQPDPTNTQMKICVED